MNRILDCALVCIASLALVTGFSLTQTKPNPTVVKTPAPEKVTAAAASREGTSGQVEKLPVRRVVLYKNGIGYFEHLGRVRGSQDVRIDFTSAQLNDVLNSLTVLDLAGGRITGVDYNSEAPLAHRLATLRLALGERPSVSEFLSALRGARLEVHAATGPVITGRLLSVERKTRTGTNWTVETDEISLVTDSGEVRIVDLNPTTSVRITERDLNVEVGRYLNLVASSRDQDVRRMTISTAGTGDRNLYVSYISEVPIWKTTYRIVLPSKPDRKPLLQGWAIIDNTVGEDWIDVELSLVAGAPHSFIQQLSEPYYGTRPVVPLPESVQLSPQTHSAMLSGGNGTLTGQVTDPSGAVIPAANVRLLDEKNNSIAQTVTDSQGRYVFSSLAQGNYHVELEKGGFNKTVISQVNVAPGENQVNASLRLGSVSQTVEVTAGAVAPVQSESAMVSGRRARTPVARRPHVEIGSESEMVEQFGLVGPGDRISSSNLEIARTMVEAAASGQELGDLFEYKLKDRVTLKKNQSALVPVAQTDIGAEKVSLWGGTSGSGRPLRGLWLKNTSALTLDGGSFSVLEDEVFAGEGLMDAIKPSERRLLSYATDLSLLVEVQKKSQPQRMRRVKIVHGIMTQVSELQERTLYTVNNQDKAARILVIEHPRRADWKLLAGTVAPDEKAVGTYRFRVEVPAKGSATLPVEEIRALETTYQVSSLDANHVALFVKQQSITPELEQALQKIIAQRVAVAKLEGEMEGYEKNMELIVQDQERLRENLKALKGSAEEKVLVQRYTQQLDKQETQLESLRKQIEETEARRDKANDELKKMIDELQIETTL